MRRAFLVALALPACSGREIPRGVTSLDVQIAPSDIPILRWAPTPSGPFEECPAYSVDAPSRRITTRTSSPEAFFRLDGVEKVLAVKAAGDQLVLNY